jgi:hypothetical protein
MRRLLRSLGEKVPKVKKGAVVTGERNRKVKAGTRKATAKVGTPQPKAKAGNGKAKGRSKTPIRKKGKAMAPRQVAKARGTTGAKSVVAIRPLDPLRKCGPSTSVQLLYRVDESIDGRRTSHLVFFDRHGWYCEHGRTCPAVGYASKFNGQIARVSKRARIGRTMKR